MPEYSPSDRLIAYAIFGGLPGQLALIDPGKTPAHNVITNILNPSGRLADEGEHLFDAFLRDGGVHHSITRAIAQGEHRWSKITSRIGKDSASVSRPLQWLQDMEIVTKIIPATDSPPGNPRRILYRLADPYLAFWHRFVSPLRAIGDTDLKPPEQLWTRHVLPHLSEYMGPIFENACRTFVSMAAHPRLPFSPDRVGEWWTEDGQEQIDVVALGPDGHVLLGECKWGQLTREDLTALERRRNLVMQDLPATTHIHLALFTGADSVRDHVLLQRMTESNVLLFTVADLYVTGNKAD